MTGQEIKGMYHDMESAAGPWRSTFRDLAKYIQPRRYHDLSSNTSGSNPGTPDRRIHADIFDSTGIEANLTCARGQLAWMTPRQGGWLGYSAPVGVEETDDVLDYLAECSKIVKMHLLKSNFYNAIFELYLERSGFGTACLLRSWDAANRKLSFRCEGDFVCAMGPDDIIDTVGVKRCYSHRTAAAIYGMENLPKEIQEAAVNPRKNNETADYIHLAIPNPDFDPLSPLWTKMRYRSTWVHYASGQIVSEGGLNDSPYLVTRYLTWTRSNPMAPFGWSPSFYAYPELCQVNRLEQMSDALVDAMVNPRILVPETMSGRVDFRPGGVTVIEDMSQKPEEWLTNGRIDISHQRAELKRQRIRKAFMVDLFEMFAQMDDRQRTAEEIRARMGEKMDNASPTFDLLADELLKPLGKWLFATLAEAGELPADIPPELTELNENGAFLRVPEVEFNSRIGLEIRAQSDYAALGTVGETLPLMQVDPTIADQFNLPKIVRARFRSSGADTNLLRSEGDVLRLQQQRQMMQAQMVAMQEEQQLQ